MSLIFFGCFVKIYSLEIRGSWEVIFVTILLIIILIISSLGVIASVLLQSGHSAGLSGAISGAGETFFGKKKGLDELLAKVAAVFAALFLLSALAMAFIQK